MYHGTCTMHMLIYLQPLSYSIVGMLVFVFQSDFHHSCRNGLII